MDTLSAFFLEAAAFLPLFAANSQHPGPVSNTVSIPLRKSGIPQAVEIPAIIKNG